MFATPRSIQGQSRGDIDTASISKTNSTQKFASAVCTAEVGSRVQDCFCHSIDSDCSHDSDSKSLASISGKRK